MKRLSHYSQHFIRNPRLIRELLRRSNVSAQDTVLDIGAGSGVISSVLATQCAQVIAIEYEPRTADKLRANMTAHPNVTVRQGDFMTMQLPNTPYKVFANIPFHLSSSIVRRLTESATPPDAIYLIVQKQFAQKLIPDGDHFTGQLGMMIGPLYSVKIRKRLLRTDFWPHPNVDTVFLELLRRPQPLLPPASMSRYRQCIEDCFSDPKLFAKTPRTRIGIPAELKPSQLRLSQWVELFLSSRYNRYDTSKT